MTPQGGYNFECGIKSIVERGDVLREWLRLARIREGMSLSDFSNKVHIDRSHLNKIENGTRNPSPAVAKAIAGEGGYKKFFV